MRGTHHTHYAATVQPAQLAKRGADAAGSGMHQPGITGFRQHLLAYHEPGGQKYRGQGRGLSVAEIARLAEHTIGLQYDMRAVTPEQGQRQHVITNGMLGHLRTDSGNHAREFKAGCNRIAMQFFG